MVPADEVEAHVGLLFLGDALHDPEERAYMRIEVHEVLRGEAGSPTTVEGQCELLRRRTRAVPRKSKDAIVRDTQMRLFQLRGHGGKDKLALLKAPLRPELTLPRTRGVLAMAHQEVLVCVCGHILYEGLEDHSHT